jgi:hypothetical protein
MHVHRGAYSAVDDGTTSIQDHGRQLLHGICSASDSAALTRVIATEEPYRAASLHSQRWDTRSRRGARTVPTRRGHPRVLRRCQLRHCGHELRVVQSPTRRELHTTDTSQSSAPHTSHTQTLAHVYQDVTSHAHTRRQRNAVQHPHRSPTAMTACSGGEPTYAREDDVHFRRRHKPVDHLRRFAAPRHARTQSRQTRTHSTASWIQWCGGERGDSGAPLATPRLSTGTTGGGNCGRQPRDATSHRAPPSPPPHVHKQYQYHAHERNATDRRNGPRCATHSHVTRARDHALSMHRSTRLSAARHSRCSRARTLQTSRRPSSALRRRGRLRHTAR